jgi:hypothetical protein
MIMKTKNVFILLLTVILIGGVITVVVVLFLNAAPLPSPDADVGSLPARSSLEESNAAVAQQQARNTAAAALLKSDPKADFIVLETDVFLNAAGDASIQSLDFTEGTQIGRIERSGKQVDWEAWDASELKIGVRVLQHPARDDVLIVVQGEKRTPYKQVSP